MSSERGGHTVQPITAGPLEEHQAERRGLSSGPLGEPVPTRRLTLRREAQMVKCSSQQRKIL